MRSEVLFAHLVIHERQERGDDEREAGAPPGVEERRQLVAQGLASTGGQHQQCGHAWVGLRSAVLLCGQLRPCLAPSPPVAAMLTRQDLHDCAFLPRAEGLVPQLLQGLEHLSWRLCRHSRWSVRSPVIPAPQYRF